MSCFDDVVSVLAATAGVPEERLEPEARLDDLGLDSLALLEVALALRSECDVELDDAAVAEAETVMDLVDLVVAAAPASAL